MPIFEYVCNACKHQFETLVLGSAKPECPSCHSKKLTKQLSVFSANTKGTASSEVAGCGSCGDPRGPGSCRMN